MCEITQCAQNYIYSIGKNSSQLKNLTLTPWAAWATNISCGTLFNHMELNALFVSMDLQILITKTIFFVLSHDGIVK